jgi:hypothetical protein
VPLARLQSEILRLIATHRDPESYVAGGAPLNVTAARISADIDLFHDREERVARPAAADSTTLQEAGFELHRLRREPALYALVAGKGGETTRLEWAVEPDPSRLRDPRGTTARPLAKLPGDCLGDA